MALQQLLGCRGPRGRLDPRSRRQLGVEARIGIPPASGSSSRDWFQDWFGEAYEQLYGHRDLDEARVQVRALIDRTGPITGPVLDAGCGSGRHLLALAELGFPAYGCDLSAHLLKTAVTRGKVLRGDLRALPFVSGSFGMVASFFTGFGYLERRSEDLDLLGEFARLVAPGGWLHLDLPDPDHVRLNLVPMDERRWPGAHVVQRRFLHGDIVVKAIHIQRDDGSISEYVERVRLWNPEHLEVMARPLGFVPVLRLGDVNGTLWEPGMARCGLVLRRDGP